MAHDRDGKNLSTGLKANDADEYRNDQETIIERSYGNAHSLNAYSITDVRARVCGANEGRTNRKEKINGVECPTSESICFSS